MVQRRRDVHSQPVHIFTKKWDMRALSVYNLSEECLREIQIGFCEADAERTAAGRPPDFGTKVSQTMFMLATESSELPELKLVFTTGAFGALFAFIKHIEFFGAFTKGCGARHRQVLTDNDARRYYELIRRQLDTVEVGRLAPNLRPPRRNLTERIWTHL